MLLLLLFASTIPPVSVVLFIIGAGIWVISLIFAARGKPFTFDGTGFGIGLMILAIGLNVLFAI